MLGQTSTFLLIYTVNFTGSSDDSSGSVEVVVGVTVSVVVVGGAVITLMTLLVFYWRTKMNGYNPSQILTIDTIESVELQDGM